MPRPKLKSDDEVLEAATVVLKRCGPIEFTLSGVAKEVGLSRAALIQRFTNRDTLLVRMMERGVEQVRHYLNAIPIGAGPQGLWEFLQVLVRSMNTRNDFSVNYLISWYELRCRSYARLRSSGTARWWRDPQATAPVLLRQLSCSCTRSSLARRCSGPSIRMVS
ncbi:hypothetical protein ECZU43_53490 [Escherichia coli]|nr:hypothetical protein ECZU43_53490 [Escherichia coli]